MKDVEFLKELVTRAIKGTEEMYGSDVLNSIFERRLKNSTIGSTFDFNSVDELRSALENADWEFAPIEQAQEMSHGSIALRTHSLGGNLGIIEIDDLPDDVKIDLKLLMPQSKKLNATIKGDNFTRPKVNFTTFVIEMDKGKNGTQMIMSTVCPGEISSKPNEFGIFDDSYTQERTGLSKDYVRDLGYKYVLLT